MSECTSIHDFVKLSYPDIEMMEINPCKLIIEDRVKLSCFYCGRYNTNWRCPPKIPDIDYGAVFREYKRGAFIYSEFPFTELTYAEVRTDSSVALHRAILEAERYLLGNGYSLFSSFIGGSCKLCKNGCGKDKCSNPYQARIPLEATGVNVVKSAGLYGINIKFPVESSLIRIGLILW